MSLQPLSVHQNKLSLGFCDRSLKITRNLSVSFLLCVLVAWATFTHGGCFCWAWPVKPFSWITWSSLTRSRSSWWQRRFAHYTCRLPPPLLSSLCWCPPRLQTAALSTACPCKNLSRSRYRATTHSHRALDSRTSLCTLGPPPALDLVQLFISTKKMLDWCTGLQHILWLIFTTLQLPDGNMDDKSAVKAKGLWEDWHMRQLSEQPGRVNHRSGTAITVYMMDVC